MRPSYWIILALLFLTFSVKGEEARKEGKNTTHLQSQSNSSTTEKTSGNETEEGSSNFLPAEGDAEKEHSSSLAILFLLCIIIMCIFFIHCVLKADKCRFLPESLAIVCFGAVVGLFMKVLPIEDIKKVESFSPNAFFLVLLPPIIFESGYNLHKGDFFQNLGSIMLFAIVGTTISALVVGGGVYLLGLADLVYKLDFVQSFAFGSLISAVDPVATLAIFQAIDVDPILNMLVFGESILNDAVAIVLTSTVIESGSESMVDLTTGEQVIHGIWRFLVVFVGSAGIGTLVALISSILLKYVDLYHNPSLEFAFMVCFVYSPYALAEGIHLSGIMSILFCGIVMSQYTHYNLSPVTQITMQQTMRTLAFMCESCVFAYLGLALFSFPHRFELALIVWSIMFTLIGRALNIFPLASLCNRFRQHCITKKMMLIMWFSGLRGAIAYALALHLEFNEDTRKVIVTTTLTVVLFTTMILGGGTMPLMKYLETKKKPKKRSRRRRNSEIRRRKEILLSKTFEMGGALESSEVSHLSELTEEEIETSSTFKIGKKEVRGFTYWNFKYIKPFLIRKFTQRELKDGKSQVTELTDKWFKDIRASPLLLSDSSEESDLGICNPASNPIDI
uniref:Sodium/hydrogen exchanger n=1 Tax=Lepeophtheirus salmonis TaxID=72036 RepID=A0A0K2USV0_LEPSM